MKLYKFITLGIALAAALTISVGAKADTFQLTQSNNGINPPAANYGTVTLLGNIGATDNSIVTIEFLATPGYMFHNAAVGWNVGTLSGGESISTEIVSICTTVGGATCSTVGGGGGFDGFGTFDRNVAGGSGSSSGLTDVKITITGVNLDLADFEDPNSNNSMFAAQVSPFPCDGCGTGWAANGGSINTSVPETSTMSLVGVGLVALLGLRRKQSVA